VVRWITFALLLLVGCNDLRDFRGDWRGPRVGDADALRVGLADDAASVAAVLSIDQIDGHGLMARLAIDGVLPETPIASLAGAEADVLAGMTFGGGPLRVYLAFAPMSDGAGEALVVIALYDDRRVEVRLLRGGTMPLYAIFALSEVSQ
jgi:hypothetical protein